MHRKPARPLVGQSGMYRTDTNALVLDDVGTDNLAEDHDVGVAVCAVC
jgi:hypothetical protein